MAAVGAALLVLLFPGGLFLPSRTVEEVTRDRLAFDADLDWSLVDADWVSGWSFAGRGVAGKGGDGVEGLVT